MKFSQRIGATDPDPGLQVESADEALRTALWNVIWDRCIDDPFALPRPTLHAEYFDDIWEYFFKQPNDEKPKSKEMLPQLKHWVLTCEWWQLYDLLEFFWTILPPAETRSYVIAVNRALEQERSAYRMVQTSIVPLTDAAEVEEITGAFRRTEQRGIEAAQDQLGKALSELSNRDIPDYDLAILHAVRALREVARMITRDTDSTLSSALKAIDPQGMLPKRFHDGLVNLFEEGDRLSERHIFREAEANPGMPEARFFIVAISALINYMLALAGPSSLESGEYDKKALPGDSEDQPKALPE